MICDIQGTCFMFARCDEDVRDVEAWELLNFGALGVYTGVAIGTAAGMLRVDVESFKKKKYTPAFVAGMYAAARCRNNTLLMGAVKCVFGHEHLDLVNQSELWWIDVVRVTPTRQTRLLLQTIDVEIVMRYLPTMDALNTDPTEALMALWKRCESIMPVLPKKVLTC